MPEMDKENAAASDASATPNSDETANLGFEEIIDKLEAIAKELEGGDIRLEESLALFEQGVRLSKLGTQRLDDAERRLEVLLGDGGTEPLELDEDGADDI